MAHTMDFTLEIASYLSKRDNSTGKITCTKSTCNADLSIYGYAPNLGANVFFTIFFALSCAVFIFQGVRYKGWWGFTIATTIGTAFEAIGYISRIMLWNNPFSDAGFKLNIVLLTFAPAFFTAGIYLLLKQFCLVFGPRFSRLKPKSYTYIFISCDVLSVALQGAGGGISAGAMAGSTALQTGVDVMIAGLSFQVVTLVVFAVLAADVAYSMWKHRNELPHETAALRATKRFKLFLGATIVAFVAIFIRCAYRIAELKGGWGNPIMRNEPEFIVLESVMITIAALAFNVFHPGHCFKRPGIEETAIFEHHYPKRASETESNVELVASGPRYHTNYARGQ
ncbi:RTA1 like protein-domain-containing protein [Delphinella strobiligena]|nr:RTA1 like protein-domain-containing protein [Delphinella strobiligena]